jgi:hypothetical protein
LGAKLFAFALSLALSTPVHAQIERLSEIVDPMTVPAAADLGRDHDRRMWQGSDIVSAKNALSSVAHRPLEGVWRASAIDLLAAGADAPVADVSQRMELALARMDTLKRLGRSDLALELFERTPGLDRDPQAARFGATLLLERGEIASACDRDDRLGEQSLEPFWVQLRIACLALAGETAAADVTFHLSQDQGIASIDMTFSGYLQALKDSSKPLPAIQPRSPIETAIAASHGMVTPTAGQKAALIDRMNTPQIEPAMRADLAREALNQGLIEISRYSDLMERLIDASLPSPSAATLREIPALDRAISIPTSHFERHQAIADPGATLDQQLAVFEALYSGASSAREKRALAFHYRNLIHSAPVQAGAANGLIFAEMAALLGDRRLAERWLEAYEATAPRPLTLSPVTVTDGPSAEAAPVVPVRQPSLGTRRMLSPETRNAILTLASVADRSSDAPAFESLARAEARAHASASGAARERIGRDVAVLIALGATPDAALRHIAPLSTGPSASLYWTLAGNARAEALLIAYGEAGLGFIQSIYAIDAMRAAGLHEQARNASVELMLSYR